MPSFEANATEIYYEQTGSRAEVPLLLIHGLGCQLIHWPKPFISRLTDSGLRVITMDNRDVGLSEKLGSNPTPSIEEVLCDPLAHEPQYSLADMAADAVALLNHLGQAGAHIVGLSMGGAIAQHMAIEYPQRVYSLTSIMSSTGNPDLPSGEAQAYAAFLSTPPPDRARAIAHNSHGWRTIGGPHYDSTLCGLAAMSEPAYHRGFCPSGVARQLLALLTAPPRHTLLGGVSIPSLVIHGAADPLVPLAAGQETAACLPNAELHVIDKMGHDLPEPLLGEIADRIIEHVRSVPITR
ncbi:MAG: alpha/beta hydrolase [Gammaproteobacteria bacterium]|nr:MAG: alpha/beta hydrolase [Gammaproteobacteria bacterium]